MMWIVRVALRRPYTFISGAILVLIAGLVAILKTPVDICPAIPLPVATVIWQYNGMSPEEMEERIVTIVERPGARQRAGLPRRGAGGRAIAPRRPHRPRRPRRPPHAERPVPAR